MFDKILNWFGKFFFTLIIFLLTDNFSRFINFLSRHSYVRNIVVFLTDIPLNESGRVIRLWLRLIVSSSIDVAFWLVVVMVFVRPSVFAKIHKTLWDNVIMVVLLLFAGISGFWSVSPNNTLNGFFLVLKITIVGIYLSQTYSPDEVLDLLVGVIALASVLSILAVWQIPEVGINGRYWHGVYSFKNFLGRLMAFGNAVLVIYWFKSSGAVFKQILAFVLFIFTGVLLISSKSATSIFILLGMYGALITYGVWKRYHPYLSRRTIWFLVLFLGILISIVVWNYEIIYATILRSPVLIALFVRSSTLSGRTVLWETLWTWFQQRPILGFGYDAFWSLFPDGITQFGLVLRHAHNGYLEIALGLGITGLLLFLAVLVIAWKESFKFLRQKEQVLFLWPILALIYFTFANLSYSVAFEMPDFHWLLFVIVSGLVTSNQIQATENPSNDK